MPTSKDLFIAYRDNSEDLETLLAQDIPLDYVDPETQDTIFHLAASKGDVAFLNQRLAGDGYQKQVNAQGETAFQIAKTKGSQVWMCFVNHQKVSFEELSPNIEKCIASGNVAVLNTFYKVVLPKLELGQEALSQLTIPLIESAIAAEQSEVAKTLLTLIGMSDFASLLGCIKKAIADNNDVAVAFYYQQVISSYDIEAQALYDLSKPLIEGAIEADKIDIAKVIMTEIGYMTFEQFMALVDFALERGKSDFIKAALEAYIKMQTGAELPAPEVRQLSFIKKLIDAERWDLVSYYTDESAKAAKQTGTVLRFHAQYSQILFYAVRDKQHDLIAKLLAIHVPNDLSVKFDVEDADLKKDMLAKLKELLGNYPASLRQSVSIYLLAAMVDRSPTVALLRDAAKKAGMVFSDPSLLDKQTRHLMNRTRPCLGHDGIKHETLSLKPFDYYQGYPLTASLMTQVKETPRAYLNLLDEKGNNVLHRLASESDYDFVVLAISRGVDVSVTNQDDKTPIDLAIEAGNYKMAAVMLKALLAYRKECQQDMLPFLREKLALFKSQFEEASLADTYLKDNSINPITIAVISGNVDYVKAATQAVERKLKEDKAEPTNFGADAVAALEAGLQIKYDHAFSKACQLNQIEIVKILLPHVSPKVRAIEFSKAHLSSDLAKAIDEPKAQLKQLDKLYYGKKTQIKEACFEILRAETLPACRFAELTLWFASHSEVARARDLGWLVPAFSGNKYTGTQAAILEKAISLTQNPHDILALTDKLYYRRELSSYGGNGPKQTEFAEKMIEMIKRVENAHQRIKLCQKLAKTQTVTYRGGIDISALIGEVELHAQTEATMQERIDDYHPSVVVKQQQVLEEETQESYVA